MNDANATQLMREQFEAWLCREMPSGTIISNPKWWAPRIIRALAAPIPRDPVGEKPTFHTGNSHFTPFYLLANARQICSREYQRQPNWVLAMRLFALGSTSATKVCRDAGIDPDGLEVNRALLTKELT